MSWFPPPPAAGAAEVLEVAEWRGTRVRIDELRPPGSRRCVVLARDTGGHGTAQHSVLLALDGAGRPHALDAMCYHLGAQLADGDIEEIGGRLVARCPLHGFLTDVGTGEALKPPAPGEFVPGLYPAGLLH